MAEPDRPFTEEDLEAIEHNLARLQESSVKRIYREAWLQCEMKGEAIARGQSSAESRSGKVGHLRC
jgi:hypothetical protein